MKISWGAARPSRSYQAPEGTRAVPFYVFPVFPVSPVVKAFSLKTGCGAQGLSLVGAFPGEFRLLAAEVAVGGG